MEIRKRPTATVEADRPPRHHRYPTSWKFGRHAAHSSQDKAIVSGLAPCKRNFISQDKAIVSGLAPCNRNFISQGKAIVARLAPSKPNKRLKCTLYLPTEIIFNILLLVPAKVLHQVVRYVCKQWNDVVNDPRFIKAHCQLSSAGLIVQNPFGQLEVFYIEGDNSTEIAFPFPARIYGSINGLVLFHDLTNKQILSVINPLTNVKISLPPVHGLNSFSSIGFAITSCGRYKVVVSVRGEGHSPKRRVIVFTLGIDKAWRFIDLRGNSEMECLPTFAPRFIAGMLCWCSFSYPCFALDVDTEAIYRFPKPDNYFQLIPSSRFISLGVGLGIIQGHHLVEPKWTVWKLTDIKAGKWTELAEIKVDEILSKVRKELRPRRCCSYLPAMLIDDIFWFYYIVDGEYAVFRFNLANQRSVFFPVKDLWESSRLFHHVHTLLSPRKYYP